MKKPKAVDIWVEKELGGNLYRGRCRKTVTGSNWRYVEVPPDDGRDDPDLMKLLDALGWEEPDQTE